MMDLVLLRMDCFNNCLDLFLHSFKHVWSFHFINGGVFINVITCSMSFFNMAWRFSLVDYCLYLFLGSLYKVWCFCIFS
uniref:Uncharacterized protein LOC105123418 n=1 Tax=Rhizophora mucronata TaxID=61149 RepID=A0A2P2IHR8_RHIMU